MHSQPRVLQASLTAATALLSVVWAASGLADPAGTVLPSISSRTDRFALTRPPDVPGDAELESAGARIGEIRVETQNIFDTSIPEEDTPLFRLGNRLHIETRESTVRSQLLFESGDPYSRRLLDETERILRRARYLQDAQIIPVAWHDGIVDVLVVTTDVWTLNPGLSFKRSGGENSSGLELEELNLLGYGTQLELALQSSVDRDSASVLLRDAQLFDTWWGGTFLYADNSDGETQQIVLDHPFYALDTRSAGGLLALRDDRIDSLYDLGEVVEEFRTRQDTATFYVGYSRGLRSGWSRRWTSGVTYDSRDFSAAPESVHAGFAPPDRLLVYPWIGYEIVEDRFETTRNRDQIERTEDVALGWRARLQLGWSSEVWGADRSALVFSGYTSKGYEPAEHSRFLLDATLQGRLENGTIRGTILGLGARFYLRQSANRLLFAALESHIGSNLDPDTQILLGGDNGLRGYPLRYQGGQGRWLATLEQRYFSNWYPFRLFNVGGAVFVDVGATWGGNPHGTPSQGVLKDVGFGLRIGNARSGLGNMLHVDVAFPLDGDPNIDSVQLLIETKASF